jgi:putative nucleotidyltransferase with HDIG domain
LPQAALRLIGILSRDDWEPAEVVEVVRLDPVLTGRVLGAANSASAAGVKKILTVDDAVRRIGPRAIAGIAIAAGVRDRMSMPLPQFGLAEGELWRHSVAALLAAEQASSHFHIPPSVAASTTALLHDVGKLLLARFLDADTVAYIRVAATESGLSAREAEREVLNISHGELGALVAAHWGLPEEIVCTTQHHHDLANAPAALRRDVALVQLADAAAKVVAPAKIRSPEESGERAGALAELGLEVAGFDAFCEAVGERFRRVGASY